MQLIIAPDERLRHVCRPDFTFSISTIQDMFRLMTKHEGCGLAANQVGIDARLFITAWGEVFVNPVIELQGEYEDIEEGCLSLPGRIYHCRRANRVLLNGDIYTGWKAWVIQHESDHLNGRLITDAEF